MNYNAMTDLELLHYLDIYSDDPLIRRLIDVLAKTRGEIISDLEDAGMDPQTWTFGDGWNKMFPGQYITDLEKQLEYANDDLDGVRYKLEQVEEERDELKTRSIMQFIEEVWQEKKTNAHKVSEALKEVAQVKEQNDKLKEQIDMWAAMNRIS
jgi:uncharacterized protein (UPF0335 family)